MTSSIPILYSWKIWIAPSCAICCMPFMNCLRFMVSTWRTLAKCSGAKVGIPSNWNGFAVVSVSPIEKIPGSNTPMISPAYASSTIWRSCAIICCGCDSLIFLLPPCTCVTSIPAVNFPEQIRINAIRSRCALFIFACILNTNAEKCSSNGSISPMSALRGSGE